MFTGTPFALGVSTTNQSTDRNIFLDVSGDVTTRINIPIGTVVSYTTGSVSGLQVDFTTAVVSLLQDEGNLTINSRLGSTVGNTAILTGSVSFNPTSNELNFTGGGTVSATDILNVIDDINPGRYNNVRLATNGDYAVNASGNLSGNETFFRGTYRTDVYDGTNIIYMIRRNIVDGGARPVTTTWAQWNGIVGANSLDPTGTGMILGGTTFPTSPAANDLFVLTAAVGAQMPNLYQRSTDNLTWNAFTFGSTMPNTRP